MKALPSILFLLLCLPSYSFGAGKNLKKIPLHEIDQVVVRYDPDVLRIPGSRIPVGINALLSDGRLSGTSGYLKGNTKWRNYKIKVEGGSFCLGHVYVDKNLVGAENEEVKVHVYHRKSGKLLKSQSIPLNYETGLRLYSAGEFRRAPGNRVDLRILKIYDNGTSAEVNPRNNRLFTNDFDCTIDGGLLKYGNLYIHEDPYMINGHTVRVITCLHKDPSVGDTLSITLDYRDDFISSFYGSSGTDGFSGSSGSSGSEGEDGGHGEHGDHAGHGSSGPDLEVFVDAYFDTLIREELLYLEINPLHSDRIRRYLVNTDGGSISIYSHGGDGGDGGDGGSGGNGGNGVNGKTVTETIQVNDSTTETITYRLPGGNGGFGGDGGNGGHGGDGGPGGNIYIDYTVYAEPYLHLVHAYSPGGDGGNRGYRGSGGSAGSGGSGDPSGANGKPGCSGADGYEGWDGPDGRIFYYFVGTDP